MEQRATCPHKNLMLARIHSPLGQFGTQLRQTGSFFVWPTVPSVRAHDLATAHRAQSGVPTWTLIDGQQPTWVGCAFASLSLSMVDVGQLARLTPRGADCTCIKNPSTTTRWRGLPRSAAHAFAGVWSRRSRHSTRATTAAWKSPVEGSTFTASANSPRVSIGQRSPRPGPGTEES